MKASAVIITSLLAVSFVLARAADWRVWGILSSTSLIGLSIENEKIQLVILFMAIISHTIVKTRMDQAIIVLMTAANLFLTQTETMLGLIIGVEALSLAGYAILIENEKGSRNSEAALRIAVPGMLATLLMATGMLLAYGQFGTLEIQQINYLMVLGICIKLALFPFSYYLIKAFEGAPVGMTVVTTYGKLGLLLNLSSWVGEGMIDQKRLWWLGIATIVFGTIFLITARRMGEWLGALIVGNGGFAITIISVPNEYFEWYIVVSQMALIVMLSTESRQNFIHYIARLSFLGFPATIVFWVKYGFLFASDVSLAQAWTFLAAGTIMTIVGTVLRHQTTIESTTSSRVADIPLVGLSITMVLLCSSILTFVII